MKTKNKFLLTLLTPLLLSTIFVATKNASQNTKEVSAITSLTGPGDYYSSIDSSLSGDSLKTALYNLNKTKRKKTVGYDGLRTTYQIFDRDWMGQDNDKIVGFYDNSLIGPSWDSGVTWNREHVWPNSRGGGSKGGSSTSPTVDQDAHMPRPTKKESNSSRGNSAYAESGAYDPASEGIENYRGIAARIIFYCAITDPQLSIVDSVSLSNTTMGKLSDLLKWNLEYLPSTSSTAPLELRVEQNRNETIQNDAKGQGNRNPFIDHPEYACKIWGDTNSTTKQICANSQITTLTKLTMNTTSESLIFGQTLSLSVTPTPSDANASVTWSSSDETIASVDNNGLVSAKQKAGYVQIVATSTYDASIKAYCNIYVTEPSNVDITSISSSNITLGVNETSQINVSYLPSNAYPIPTYTYSSNDNNIATIDSNGLIKGISEGNTAINITATQGENVLTSTCNVTVNAAPTLKNDSITKDDLVSTNYSSNETESSTSNNTKFKYINVGCYDKATLQFRKDTGCLWNSEALPLKKIEIDVTNGNFLVYGSNTEKGKTNLISLGSDGKYDLTGYTYFYICSSSGAANANSINITYSGSSSSDSISLDKTSLTLNVGDEYTLKATSTGEITWFSSNEEVATVDTNGNIKALSVGNTTISAKTNDAIATCEVIVKEKEIVTLASISTSNQKTKFNLNESFVYDGICTATYSDGSTKAIAPTISQVDTSKIGTQTVILSYTEDGVTKTTTYTITITDPSLIIKNENSVEKVYSQSQGTLTFDVYGIYVGLANGNTPMIMNGEFGMMLYGSTSNSSWIVGETVLKASKPKLAIYNNLYELNKPSLSIVSDEETIEKEIYPIKTYTITGEETSSDLTLANRYSNAAGVITSMNRTSFSSSSDLSANMLVNNKTINIFVKKNTVITQEIFDAMKDSLDNQTPITIEGFTSIYNTTFQLSLVKIVEKDVSYTAENFASDFMSLTNSVCLNENGNNYSSLTPIWMKLESSEYYLKLSSEQIDILINTTYFSESTSTIELAMKRYDHIVEKYGLNNFIKRAITPSSRSILNNTIDNNFLNIFAILIPASTVAIGLLILKKKKEY